MSTTWQQMPQASVAAYQHAIGCKLHAKGEVFWQKIRPCFFRPTQPYAQYQKGTVPPPLTALLGAYQHAVPEGHPANSTLNCLLFRNLTSYSPATLPTSLRRQIKIAEKTLSVRPITDRAEFASKGHAIYLSFHARTNYRVGADRNDPQGFATWTENLFDIPELLILGGYHNDELAGVCISFLCGETLTYATTFCTTESLKQYLPGLLLHRVRELAAAQPDIRQIFVGMKKEAEGVDGFYLMRGAQVIRLPAYLHLNPLVASLLRRYRPKIYKRLHGIIETGCNIQPTPSA